jgi:hypothetical protein
MGPMKKWKVFTWWVNQIKTFYFDRDECGI